jgi:hypothetical protein
VHELAHQSQPNEGDRQQHKCKISIRRLGRCLDEGHDLSSGRPHRSRTHLLDVESLLALVMQELDWLAPQKIQMRHRFFLTSSLTFLSRLDAPGCGLEYGYDVSLGILQDAFDCLDDVVRCMYYQ